MKQILTQTVCFICSSSNNSSSSLDNNSSNHKKSNDNTSSYPLPPNFTINNSLTKIHRCTRNNQSTKSTNPTKQVVSSNEVSSCNHIQMSWRSLYCRPPPQYSCPFTPILLAVVATNGTNT